MNSCSGGDTFRLVVDTVAHGIEHTQRVGQRNERCLDDGSDELGIIPACDDDLCLDHDDLRAN